MTFEEIFNARFDLKQRRIKEIKEKNDQNKKNFNILGEVFVGFSLLLAIFITILFFSLGFFNFLIGIVLFIFFAIILFIPLTKPMDKIENLNNKLKSDKYNIYLSKNKYSIIFNKIKICNLKEFKENKNYIIQYINNLTNEQQEEIIEMINRKIDLHDNGIKNIEKRIDNLSYSTNKNKNILKSI